VCVHFITVVLSRGWPGRQEDWVPAELSLMVGDPGMAECLSERPWY
jgi:hypothetical protein